MKTKWIWIPAAALAAVAFMPLDAVAQGGPPPWVKERISGARGQRAEGAREGVIRERTAERVVNANAPINGCAPGLEVARRTPAGPILAAIFGAGGPASHARPGCRDDDLDDRDDRDDDRRDGRGARSPVERGRRQIMGIPLP